MSTSFKKLLLISITCLLGVMSGVAIASPVPQSANYDFIYNSASGS
jgi:hypothetical protein